ncbi:biotin-dependent carboxyltransferase family protein [Streptomyces ochraceiscleroticus]|uniref:Biotin-dependent carboxyltransferase family protein n=1 Tax=Streptomyces ochraceiscleroticus TaxID=47761 RepID=A0ABW1MRZ9_9ACTN|nr:biotin-dependent carboxyltransferase family protein [Streptomyces ochraceiscleroticus]
MTSTGHTDRKTVPALEIVDPGLQTTVQDYPGRLGLQSLGFFPAGPADHLAFRVANVLVGNRPGAAALEIPRGRFHAVALCSGLVAVCGASGVDVTLNDRPVPTWQAVPVSEGDSLRCSVARGPGFRLYLAVSGGIAVPEVFGSMSTFLVGGIGGLDGRALAPADVLNAYAGRTARRRGYRLPVDLRPRYTSDWEIEILRGPHADPEFLTEADYKELLSNEWRVDVSSDRAATRFHPHRFRWARDSGDIAGGHPSSVLDGCYPLGGILAYGDTLTVLGPDGHVSGGSAVVATVAHASLWKIGQLRPGRDTVRLREIDLDQAAGLDEHAQFILRPEQLEPL